MEKRGQIYILAVILLAVAIYSLSTIVNVVQQEEIRGDFKSLSTNFETESSKLINSVLQSGGDVQDSFANFTFLFTSYSKAKSPNFNIFYALAYGDDIYFGNFMDEAVYIYIPCPRKDSCEAIHELSLAGCFSNISARISFDGLNVQFNPEWDDLFNTVLKPKCIQSISIGNNKEYCLSIGGLMYNLAIDPNVPKIFSLSRLKSGNQILNSAQGEVGQEQVCDGRTKDNCCLEFCHWHPKKEICLEGMFGLKNHTCGNSVCDPGENCGNCPQDCICCSDGTRDGRCSSNKPRFCDDGSLIDACATCKCPIPDQQKCLTDGHCCVKKGKPCDGTFHCCNREFYYCDGTCKQYSEICENNKDDDGDGKTDCDDPDCEGYCSATKPKRCIGKAWVNDCDECGCPPGNYCHLDGSCVLFTCSDGTLYDQCSKTKPLFCDDGNLIDDCDTCNCPSGKTCQHDGRCLSLKKFLCKDEYWTGWGRCGGGRPSCISGYSRIGSDRKKCYWYSYRYRSLCRKEYWTACSENPSCGTFTKISERVC